MLRNSKDCTDYESSECEYRALESVAKKKLNFFQQIIANHQNKRYQKMQLQTQTAKQQFLQADKKFTPSQPKPHNSAEAKQRADKDKAYVPDEGDRRATATMMGLFKDNKGCCYPPEATTKLHEIVDTMNTE